MPAITYTIAMPQPHTHLFDVTLEVDNVSGVFLDVALPVWTPGSYLVREYARHLQSFSAESNGQPLAWQKLDKATWRITTGGATSISIHYQVYAFELTVRTSHLDDTHGYFNPATLCLYVPGRLREQHLVRILPPDGWRVTTGLPAVDGSPATFLAQDYDELVDSPFECGTHRVLAFEVDGIPHEIALWGHGNEDEQRLLDDTKTIVESARDLFGSLPYQRYVFIVHLSDGLYGGLEHRNSVTNLLDRWTFQPRRSYERFLGLTSHEFFHVWNVKRIRPEPLGPFDYSRENYTRQLWVAEGITSYYDNLILVRTGLISPERYLETLADDIKSLQSQPGRAIQSLEQSSFDTWIKFYRPDENSQNTSISYYLKGSLVALLLDLEIRHQSGGLRSLDDVMRSLYHEQYGGDGHTSLFDGPGIPEEGGFLAAVEAVAGEAGGRYRELLERYVSGTEELDYAQAFRQIGVAVEWSYARPPEDGSPATLGVRLKTEHGRTRVAIVYRNGPAERAGVYAGDELVALEDFRVDEERLKARLAERKPGDTVTLALFRGDRLLQIPVTLDVAAYDQLRLIPDEDAGEKQQQLYRDWIG